MSRVFHVMFFLFLWIFQKDTRTKYVVAVYREDVRWVFDIDDDAYVYFKNRKTMEDMPREFTNQVLLPNVGRESHTYLMFILNHYDDLPENVIFTQGCFNDHCPDLLEEPKIRHSVYLSHQIISVKDSLHIHLGYLGNDVERICNHLFVEWPIDILFGTGAILLVTKKQIKNRSVRFYQECLQFLDYDSDPPEGHVFERIWGLIFDPFIVSRF